MRKTREKSKPKILTRKQSMKKNLFSHYSLSPKNSKLRVNAVITIQKIWRGIQDRRMAKWMLIF